MNQYTSTSQPSESFSYDADGNLTADGAHRFEWDAENRLKTVLPATTQPTAGDLKSVYDYDYLGRRTRKRVFHWDAGAGDWSATPDLDRRFVYDGWNLVTEMDGLDTDEDGSPAILRQFTWGLDLSGLNGGQNGGAWAGPGGVSNMGDTGFGTGGSSNMGGTGFQPVSDSALPAMHAAGGIGGLLAVLDWTLVTPQSSGLGHAYFYDGNGNVGQLLSLDDGSVVTAYEYDAYGNVTAETDGEYAPENPFRFSTKFHDDDTGWVYYGYRFYGPKWGRWASRDPIGELGGIALLEALAGAPTFAYDSLGLKLGVANGEQSLKKGLGLLEKACERNCKYQQNRPCCPVYECKYEAVSIVAALIEAWRRNWGMGPFSDAGSSPTVGGYYCWDWANIFDDALTALKPVCLTFERGLAWGPPVRNGRPGETYVHYYLRVYACGDKHSPVSFDDGLMDGSHAAHSGIFPRPNTGYVPGEFQRSPRCVRFLHAPTEPR
ncbi:MAG: RHS repeat-associated core domain-containing protein [Phycisphaerae bacterium]